MQQAGGAGAYGPGVDGIQLAVQRGDGVAVVFVVCQLQVGFKLAEFAVAVDNILKCRHVERRRFLIYPGQGPVAWKGVAAAVRGHLALQQ
ncbi:hypothetical protein D3C78_1111140 [compost metagenome]